jgi:apolipoprotein N-acyltransferase
MNVDPSTSIRVVATQNHVTVLIEEDGRTLRSYRLQARDALALAAELELAGNQVIR